MACSCCKPQTVKPAAAASRQEGRGQLATAAGLHRRWSLCWYQLHTLQRGWPTSAAAGARGDIM